MTCNPTNVTEIPGSNASCATLTVRECLTVAGVDITGGGGGAIGPGTPNNVTRWLTPGTVGDSVITDDGGAQVAASVTSLVQWSANDLGAVEAALNLNVNDGNVPAARLTSEGTTPIVDGRAASPGSSSAFESRSILDCDGPNDAARALLTASGANLGGPGLAQLELRSQSPFGDPILRARMAVGDKVGGASWAEVLTTCPDETDSEAGVVQAKATGRIESQVADVAKGYVASHILRPYLPAGVPVIESTATSDGTFATASVGTHTVYPQAVAAIVSETGTAQGGVTVQAGLVSITAQDGLGVLLGFVGVSNGGGNQGVVTIGSPGTVAPLQEIGAYGQPGTTRQTVVGSRGGNAALASLLTALDAIGWIIDGSTP